MFTMFVRNLQTFYENSQYHILVDFGVNPAYKPSSVGGEKWGEKENTGKKIREI